MAHVQRWRFGPFEVDVDEHRLLRDGEPVALTRKAFALLSELLRRPGRLVTKAELFDTVWAGTIVTDAALSRVVRELRVALGDDAAAPRYIATAHGLGFRFVAVVASDAVPEGPAAPAGTAAAFAGRLVGRDRELARLDQALADARAGHRQVVFVTGEAGIGKTALVEAFLRRQASGDTWTAQGRCVEQYGTGEAYLPILEALEHLARAVGVKAFGEVLLRYAPAWLAQLPWLAYDADRELLRRATGESSAQGMLRDIVQALEVLAAQKPIVLWLEDLHWSDPSSLAVIAFLAGRRYPARLLLVASFRPVDAQADASPLHALALQLAQRGQAVQMALAPLDASAVGQYLRARFGASANLAALSDFLCQRGDGNALFTVAMVDDLVRRRHLTEQDGTWVLSGSVAELGHGLPDDLRHLVQQQIERLSEEDRRLVEAAAVAGTDFAAASVAAALQDSLAAIEDRCARLVQQGRLLRLRESVSWPDGTISAGFGFLHALYWQGTYERVPESRRADWQRRIGLTQEHAYGGQCAEIAAELAMRFEVARDFQRALRYLEMAGANALACGAYLECVELLRHALDLLPHVPEETRSRRELDLLLPLGAASMAAQGYASKSVESTYQRALALCRECGRPGELVRVLRGLWNVVFLQADLVHAQQAAEELLAIAGKTAGVSLSFDAHTKLGQTCMHRGDMAGARRHLEYALALPEADDDPVRRREAPRAIAYLAWVLWYTGYPDQALERGREALRLSRLEKSPHSKAFALGFISWLHFFLGDIDRAIELAREQRALSVEHGLVYWRTWADFTHGMTATQSGDPVPDTATMSAAIEEMRSTGAEVGIVHFLCFLGSAELSTSQLQRASQTMAAAQSLMALNGNEQNASEVQRILGRLAVGGARDGPSRDEAERRFVSSLNIAKSQGARTLELRAATELALLWAECGQAERAMEQLGGVYAAFTEGFDTVDLLRARVLLDQWGWAPAESERPLAAGGR